MAIRLRLILVQVSIHQEHNFYVLLRAVMHMHDSPFCASSDENSCRIYNHACMNYKLGGYSRSTATMPDFSLAYALLARVAMRIVLGLIPLPGMLYRLYRPLLQLLYLICLHGQHHIFY